MDITTELNVNDNKIGILRQYRTKQQSFLCDKAGKIGVDMV